MNIFLAVHPQGLLTKYSLNAHQCPQPEFLVPPCSDARLPPARHDLPINTLDISTIILVTLFITVLRMRRPSAGAMLCFLLPQAAMLQLAKAAHAKVIYRAKCSSDRKMPNTNSGTKTRSRNGWREVRNSCCYDWSGKAQHVGISNIH